RLALAGPQVVADFQLRDHVLAVGPLGQAHVQDVTRRLVAFQRAQRCDQVALFRFSGLELLDFGDDLADAFDLDVLHRANVQLDAGEGRRGQVLELLGEDAVGFLGLVDVDVVPLTLAEPGQVLDQARVPLGTDPHHRQLNLFLGGLLGQLAAGLLARGLAVGQDDDLRNPPGARVLLDLPDAHVDAFVHRGPARIDVEHVDAVDRVLDLLLLGDFGRGQDHLAVVGEGDDGEAVVGLEFLDGGQGRVLDAFQPADPGAVFLVHGSANVQNQG